MRSRILKPFPTAILAAIACLPRSLPAQTPDWEKEELAWRGQHAADLQKPDGWLSLIALEWLAPGDIPIGSGGENKIRLPATAPAHLAVLKLESGVVTLLSPAGGFPAGLKVNGAEAREQVLRVDPDRDKFNSRLTWGTFNLYVIRRAERFALRVKDAKSPSLEGFHGLKWYEPSAAYRLKAKWIPYLPPKSVTLVTLVGTSYSQPVPGYAEFRLEGKAFRIEPVLEDPQSTRLFFILKDATSGHTTYPACRFLYAPIPDHGLDQPGEIVLDFNKMENPPCAYTPYATCPLPPAGNRLPVALPVGEQRYHK